jgi:hypothetical protein
MSFIYYFVDPGGRVEMRLSVGEIILFVASEINVW